MRLYLNADGEAPEASLYKLRYVGEELIKKDLESLDGVAAVKVNGGYEEEIQVHVDEAKLALVGLTPRDIQEVLARENVNQAAAASMKRRLATSSGPTTSSRVSTTSCRRSFWRRRGDASAWPTWPPSSAATSYAR